MDGTGAGGWDVCFTSLCRLQQLLVEVLAGHDVTLQLGTVGHREHLGLLAVLEELVEVGLQVAQHLLVLTRQHGLYLQRLEGKTENEQSAQIFELLKVGKFVYSV